MAAIIVIISGALLTDITKCKHECLRCFLTGIREDRIRVKGLVTATKRLAVTSMSSHVYNNFIEVF